MLSTFRRLAALAVLVLFFCTFINLKNEEPGETANWLQSIQFVPAWLGTVSGKTWALAALIGLTAATLLFGRVYCSFLCPLGILQDIAIRARKLYNKLLGRKQTGKTVRYTQPVPYVRYAVLLATVAAMTGGSALLLTWLDPYTIAARFAAGYVNPLAANVNNLLLDTPLAAPLALTHMPPDWMRYGLLLIPIAAFILLPLAFAWQRGRLYCNTLCPVGALLGLISRRPLFRLSVDSASCVKCGNCLKACKAHCIDLKTHEIDTSRCINCYNCVTSCDAHGLRPRFTNPFKRRTAPAAKPAAQPQAKPAAAPDMARRAFLGSTILGASAMLSSCKRDDISGASLDPAKTGTNTGHAATPPGSKNLDFFLDRCTGCGLCITACPTHVLQPSYTTHGLKGFMKPYMNFTKGFCNFDCNICGTVCPEGAIAKLPLPDKKKIQIALAEFHRDRCVVQQNRTECGACTEHCPTKALFTVEETFPILHPDKCNGCGKCIRICPQEALSVQTDADGNETAVLDNKKCIACGKCATACRKRQAISLQKLLIPQMDNKLCIGCGACTYACPVRPDRAMTMTPRLVQLEAVQKIEAPAENPVSTEEFPF